MARTWERIVTWRLAGTYLEVRDNGLSFLIYDIRKPDIKVGEGLDLAKAKKMTEYISERDSKHTVGH